MSYIVIPGGKRARQPQRPVRIDWASPYTRGLVLGGVGSIPALDFVTSSLYSVANSTPTATPYGVAAGLSGTGSGINIGAPSSLNFGANYYSFFMYCIPRAIAGARREILIGRDDSTTRSFTMEINPLGQSGSGPNQTGAVAVTQFATNSNVASYGTDANVAVTGVPISILGGKNTASSFLIYVNGVSNGLTLANGPTWGNVQTSSRTAYVGRRGYSSFEDYFQGDVLAWAIYNGVAPYAELAKALNDNPWQLFAPSRRVVVFGAAAGGGPTAYPLTASPATATLTGTDATFVYTPASTAYPLTASAGTATFAGSAATFSWGRAVNAAAGTAALAGSAATFSKGYQVTASAGTLTATGTAATFEFTGLVQYALTAEPSVVTVTGTSATFAYTGALVYTLTASPGSMTLTGRAATVGIPPASIWTDVGVSAATWSDVGPATSIWTDI
jgi:hypothetical protein